MQDASPISSELRAMAGSVLGDLLTWQYCGSQRGPFLQRCVSQLALGESVTQSLGLCRKVRSPAS